MLNKKGDPENARFVNRTLVLNLLRRGDPQSRADLARRLGLSKMTISQVVSDLIDEKFIIEVGEGASMSTGGRKPILLELDCSACYVIGLDIGLTNTVVALGSLKGEKLIQFRVPANKKHDAESILAQIEELVDAALAKSGKSKNQVLGVGISIGGLIDSTNGHVLFSPDFGWKDVPLRETIEQRIALRTTVDNCTRAMAFGEQWYEKAYNANNIFYINLGHGIGSAIVMQGRVYNNNSEFGHIKITNREVHCDCGKMGCLEAVASGHAIERIAGLKLKRKTRGADHSAKAVAELALAGNDDAKQIFHDAGRYIGRAISIAATLFNPDKVVIAGGVAEARELLEKSLMAEYEANTMDVIKNSTDVLFSSFGMDAGVNGAIAMALNRYVFHEEAAFIAE